MSKHKFCESVLLCPEKLRLMASRSRPHHNIFQWLSTQHINSIAFKLIVDFPVRTDTQSWRTWLEGLSNTYHSPLFEYIWPQQATNGLILLCWSRIYFPGPPIRSECFQAIPYVI